MSPFGILNTIQFLAAINENLYKLLAAFFLINEFGDGSANTVMAVIGAIFILPFLLFSSLGGIFADRFPKNHIVVVTRILEFLCLVAAAFLFYYHSTIGAYVVLFLMASLGAIFGPSKYGIIPELIHPSKLLYANSMIAAFTFLGIIIGTTLASFMVWVTHGNYVLALMTTLFFVVLELILSFCIHKTPVSEQKRKARIFIYAELWDGAKQMHSIPSLGPAAFAYAYFLFVGAYVQLNTIPYTVSILKRSDVIGGYLFLLTALGLGLGAFFTDRISKGEIKLKFIPLSGIGISIFLVFLAFLSNIYLVIIWMLALGFLGGMFLVPSQAYILAASPTEDRGRNFATANFFSFAFALLASFALYLFNTTMKLSPAMSYFIVALINLAMMAFIIRTTGWLKKGSLPQSKQ